MVSRRSSWIALGFAAILSAALVGLGIGSQCDLCSSGGSDIGISGTATYGGGAPAAGVRICFICSRADSCDGTAIECYTDANGYYEIFLGGSCPTGDDGTYTGVAGQCNPTDTCWSNPQTFHWDGASHLVKDFILQHGPGCP